MDYIYPEYSCELFEGGDICLTFKHVDDCGAARVILVRDDAEGLLGLLGRAVTQSLRAEA